MFKEAYNQQNNTWREPDARYTTKEGCNWLSGQREKVNWHHWVWNAYNVPRHSFIAWMAALGKLRTKESLFKAGVCHDRECMLCIQGEESCHHLFFRCVFSRKIIICIMQWLGIGFRTEECLYESWSKWERKYRSKQKQKVCYAALAVVVYYIWQARNKVYWEKAIPRPERVVRSIQQEVCARITQNCDVRWTTEEIQWLYMLNEQCN